MGQSPEIEIEDLTLLKDWIGVILKHTRATEDICLGLTHVCEGWAPETLLSQLPEDRREQLIAFVRDAPEGGPVYFSPQLGDNYRPANQAGLQRLKEYVQRKDAMEALLAHMNRE